MRVLDRIRAIAVVPPLPPARPTSEILSDLDRQVGRLSSVRDRAAELVRRIEDDKAG